MCHDVCLIYIRATNKRKINGKPAYGQNPQTLAAKAVCEVFVASTFNVGNRIVVSYHHLIRVDRRRRRRRLFKYMSVVCMTRTMSHAPNGRMESESESKSRLKPKTQSKLEYFQLEYILWQTKSKET